jgi:hypothetical protein
MWELDQFLGIVNQLVQEMRDESGVAGVESKLIFYKTGPGISKPPGMVGRYQECRSSVLDSCCK